MNDKDKYKTPQGTIALMVISFAFGIRVPLCLRQAPR